MPDPLKQSFCKKVLEFVFLTSPAPNHFYEHKIWGYIVLEKKISAP